MKTKTPFPFTIKQFKALKRDECPVIEQVLDLLNPSRLDEFPETDKELSRALNLFRRCEGPLPPEEERRDLRGAIRRKFEAIYRAALVLAHRALVDEGLRPGADFHFALLIDAQSEDDTQVAVLDYRTRRCYLHEAAGAWQFQFGSLTEIVREVLRIKTHLVEQIVPITQNKPAAPERKSKRRQVAQRKEKK
jgi:hypothetical protein